MGVVSDKIVKNIYMKKLREHGFSNIEIVGNEGYDIRAQKNNDFYFFEIKSSTKKEGENFFGCVMLTELYKAIQNRKRYFFVVCRKIKGKWRFREFPVDEFLEYCTFTTPIFHYQMIDASGGMPSKRKHRAGTMLASDQLITEAWDFFQRMKSQYGLQ